MPSKSLASISTSSGLARPSAPHPSASSTEYSGHVSPSATLNSERWRHQRPLTVRQALAKLPPAVKIPRKRKRNPHSAAEESTDDELTSKEVQDELFANEVPADADRGAPPSKRRNWAYTGWSSYEQSALYSIVRSRLRAMKGDSTLISDVDWDSVAFNLNLVCEGQTLPKGSLLADSSRGQWKGHGLYGRSKSAKVMHGRHAKSVRTFLFRQEGKAVEDVLAEWLKDMSEEDRAVGEVFDKKFSSNTDHQSANGAVVSSEPARADFPHNHWADIQATKDGLAKEVEEVCQEIQADPDLMIIIHAGSKARIAKEVAILEDKVASRADAISSKKESASSQIVFE